MEHPKLQKEKILEILTKVEDTKEVEVISFSLRPGAEKGDNYSGIVIACDVTAKVRGEEKSYNWIIKMPPDDAGRVAFGRDMHMEEKEIKMYAEVIPAFRRLIAERKADIEINFAPCPYTEYHPEPEKGSFIVMQNLLHVGYADAADKKKGLNIHYAKAALAEMAKFHALGHVYFKTLPKGHEEDPMLTNDYFCHNQGQITKDLFASFKSMMIAGFVELLETAQEPGQDFAGTFMAFHEKHDSIEFRNELYGPKEGQFNTFCHGDTWFNNMLFYHEKTADGKEIATKAALIDLALTRWSSPATDLAYFLFLSVTPQLRRTHLDEMLGHYHDTLIRCLHQLGEDPTIYPYRQLLKDYDRYRYVGLLMSLWVLPAILCKKEDAMGQEEMGDWQDKEKLQELMEKGQEKWRTMLRNEPQIKMVVAGNFLEMQESGFFNK